jgi:cytochrome P450
VMGRLADAQLRELVRRGQARLDRLSFALAVGVVASVIGLTGGRPGMGRRLERFFAEPPDRMTGLAARRHALYRHAALAPFYLCDVRPAVRARRRQRADDMISYLIDVGYTSGEILTECVTFAPAGMITTREFINVAAWHLLTDDALRARYRDGDEPERLAILQELLRLEPVVSTLWRRTTAPVEVPGPAGTATIPAGCLVSVELADANIDPAAVGPEPHAVRPGRALGDGVKESGLSFGDGPHRCPGEHVALQESDIFLHKLLSLDGLRLAAPPTVRFKKEIGAVELRGPTVVLDRGR